MSPKFDRKIVDSFILDQIETVPRMEALLILRGQREKAFSAVEVAKLLFISDEASRELLAALAERGMLRRDTKPEECFQYSGSGELDELIAEVEITYRRELVRVSNMLHSRASAGVRDFAKAFRITKERE